MKVEYVSGCICGSLTIDGKETADIPLKELRDCVLDIISRTTDISLLQDILTDAAQCSGEFEDLGHCEQCGDWIEKFTLEI